MARVAIDIDDTLYSFTDKAREVLYDMYLDTGDERFQRSSYAAWPEWRSPTDTLCGDVDKWLEVIDICHSDENILSRKAYDGAAEVCWDIWNAGHEILYITNRRPDSDLVTGAWLLEQGFPVAADGNVELKCGMEDKIANVRTCRYLIDDRVKTLVAFVTDFNWKLSNGSTQKPRTAFALQRPYNLNMTDVREIKIATNWRGLKHYLEREGVIGVADRSSNDSRASRVS